MKRYIYLAGAVTCILFLYFLGVIAHPADISISEVEKYEGKKVTVEGTVTEKYCSKNSETLTIKDDNYSTNVFIRGSTDVQYGDRIKVTGKVERYGNQIEIYADSVKMVKKWDGGSIPLRELSENFMSYIGTNVNVTGYVDGIHKSYFYLTDSGEEHKIKVYYPGNFSMDIDDYEHVYVRAMFKYDPEKMCMYLQISEKNHGVTRID